MEKTSKIVKAYEPKKWTSKEGATFWFRNIEMENGDKGQIGSKEEQPDFLKVGVELIYTITTDETGSKLKRVQLKKDGFKSFGRSPEERKEIVRQSSLKCALDYYVAFGRSDGKKVSPSDVIEMAEMFTEWVITHK